MFVIRVLGRLFDDPGVSLILVLLVTFFFLSGDLGVQRVPVQSAALEKSSRHFGRSVPGKGAAQSIQPQNNFLKLREPFKRDGSSNTLNPPKNEYSSDQLKEH